MMRLAKELSKSLLLLSAVSLLLVSVCSPSLEPAKLVSYAYQVWTGPETTEITVPYHVVRYGDSLGAICWRLKDEYGDQRDWRIIADSIIRDNNKKDARIYIGEKLSVRLQVPVENAGK